MPANWRPDCLERGYFQGPKTSGARTHQIVVAHSLGVHFINAQQISSADLLVIIAGFEQFHLSEKASSCRTVRRMLARISDDPDGTLNDFYAACFGDAATDGPSYDLPQMRDQAKANLGLLREDLQFLDTHHLDLDVFAAAPQILILHGQNDRIVPVEHAHMLHEKLTNSALVIHPQAGHALPFTESLWCIRKILEHIVEPIKSRESVEVAAC